jgi:hypothetical protein
LITAVTRINPTKAKLAANIKVLKTVFAEMTLVLPVAPFAEYLFILD